MRIERFEDILAWQKAEELTILIYGIFRNNRDYGFRDQIMRASVSIMNNIAEGYERRTNKDFKHFLYISKGSCGEVRSMTHLAYKIQYVCEDDYDLLNIKSIEISKMLSGLIKTL